MRKFYCLPVLLLLFGTLVVTAATVTDTPSDPKAAPPIAESLAASLGKDIVAAAHPTAKKIALVEHKQSKNGGQLIASLKMEYRGKVTGAKYTANIRITIDPAKSPHVVDVVYKDDNRIRANKKNLEGVRPSLDSKLKDAKLHAKAAPAASDVAADIAAVERLLRVGKGSQSFVEKKAGQRIADWKRAAESGSPGGQYLYGRALGLGAGVAKDQKEALRWYRKAADAGFPLAQNALGVCSAEGKGVPKDEREAARWYRKAADGGLPVAQNSLGRCYKDGTGVEKSRRQAVELYRKAAEAGHAYSFFELGVCYVNGEGVSKDTAEAEKCYQRGAEAGDFDCQLELANWNLDGRAEKAQIGEALKLLKQAEAQADDAIAKRKVEHARVRAYQKSGIEQLDKGNKVEAARMLRDALNLAQKLDKDYPGRFYIEDALGGCYLQMARYHEEANELEKAAACYQKASDLGAMKATQRLAKLYEKGAGVPADPKKAQALRARADNFKMYRITIPCEWKATGRKVPIDIYLRDDFRGAGPLESQELWYKDEGILIPAQIKEAIAKLLKIAQENKVSFVELCKYAFEQKDSAPSQKEKKP